MIEEKKKTHARKQSAKQNKRNIETARGLQHYIWNPGRKQRIIEKNIIYSGNRGKFEKYILKEAEQKSKVVFGSFL